jgi:hypothetical protein
MDSACLRRGSTELRGCRVIHRINEGPLPRIEPDQWIEKTRTAPRSPVRVVQRHGYLLLSFGYMTMHRIIPRTLLKGAPWTLLDSAGRWEC